MPHLQQGAKVLGKKALQTGAQVAQDVLEGNNVNTALATRSKEAIGGLVPQAGSGQKCTKRKVQFRGLPQNYTMLIPVIFNHFTTMSRVKENNLPFLHLLTCCPEHGRQFLLETDGETEN